MPAYLYDTYYILQGKIIHCQLEGVNELSASVKFFGGKFNLLNENKRLVVVIEEDEKSKNDDDDDGDDEGEEDDDDPLRVALVIIGGVGVNTITYDEHMLGTHIDIGDELSTFRAGGSAFALFTTKPLQYIEQLSSGGGGNSPVEALVGETIAY